MTTKIYLLTIVTLLLAVTGCNNSNKKFSLREQQTSDTSLNDRDPNDNYPKTAAEKKEEEIGSLLGGDGIIFKPGIVKNETTKTEGKANGYLWEASFNVLSFVPTTFEDYRKGIIITKWHEDKSAKLRYKITVNISDNIISPKSIHVNVEAQKWQNGKWTASFEDIDQSAKFEEMILRKAREIYITNNK